MLNLNWHDRNSNALVGFLHIKARLVHTTAGKEVWHLFWTPCGTSWVGFMHTDKRKGPIFNQKFVLYRQILMRPCKLCGQPPTQPVLHWAQKQMRIIQCEPGLLIIHNKRGIQEAPTIIGGEYRNQWGLRTTVQPWLSPCAGLQVVFTSSFGLKQTRI